MPSSGVQTCARSEEHTSELQSHDNLVCRLLLEKKKHDGERRARRTVQAGVARREAGARRRQAPPRLAANPAVPFPRRADLCALCFFFLKVAAPPELSPFPLPPAFRF